MKTSEAKKLVCPFMSNFVTTMDGGSELLMQNCICEECMFWATTLNGKIEVDRETEPYDMTSYDIRNWSDHKKIGGYVNIGRDGGFRNVYVKYEENMRAIAKG